MNWAAKTGPSCSFPRRSNSGTYTFFLEEVIRQGKKDSKLLFSPDTLLLPSSEGISEEIRQNPNTIGYDGLGYVTPAQKMIAIAKLPTGPYVTPSLEAVTDGSYPISRPLFMYTPGQPNGVIKTYLDWILNEGQQQVRELGFVPLGEVKN
ncbi:MAG: substrate-binding domain-containing protein [Anaerolineae bacterium]